MNRATESASIELRGEAWHLRKLAEECVELAGAILKHENKGSPMEDVMVEIADVEIAIQFFKRIHGDATIKISKNIKEAEIERATIELIR